MRLKLLELFHVELLIKIERIYASLLLSSSSMVRTVDVACWRELAGKLDYADYFY